MRRPLAIVTLLVSVALVGAAVAGVGPFERPPDVRVTDDAQTSTVLDPFRYRNTSNRVSHVHVGDTRDGRPQPIAFLLLNDGPDRSFPVSVRYRSTNVTVYEETLDLPENGSAVVVFHRPADYTVTVTTATGASTVLLDEDQFDCNDQTYGLAVDPDGQTALTRTGTTMACG